MIEEDQIIKTGVETNLLRPAEELITNNKLSEDSDYIFDTVLKDKRRSVFQTKGTPHIGNKNCTRLK